MSVTYVTEGDSATPAYMNTLLNRAAGDVYIVLEFGAAGDGSTDDAASIQSTIDSADSGGKVLFPSGRTYVTSRVTITKPLTVIADGSNFSLTGTGAGFVVQGNFSDINVRGGRIVGSTNTLHDQIAWLFGDDGSNLSRIKVQNVVVEGCRVGLKFSGSATTRLQDVMAIGCSLTSVRGTVGGSGYGIQFTECAGYRAIGNNFDHCERHSLYMDLGRGGAAVGNSFQRHRSSVVDGSSRAALSISRAENVTATGNTFFDCNDVDLIVDTDSQGTQCRNVSVVGNVFSGSSSQAVVIGNTGAASEGTTENVSVVGNSFYRAPAQRGQTFVEVSTGRNISVANNVFHHESSPGGASWAAIFLRGSSAAARTNRVNITDNVFNLSEADGTAYDIEFGANVVASGGPVVHYTGNLRNVESSLLFDDTNNNANLRISHQASIPATGTASGVSGDFAFGAGFMYVCTSSASWSRATLNTF